MINLYNQDCLEFMKGLPDKAYELAIVDPPYGIGFGTFNRTNRDASGNRFKADRYKNEDWDDGIPTDEYFAELRRISANQIVWGGNYFPALWDNGCKGFIYWHKGNPVPNFADGELAWTSFNKVAKQFDFPYYGGLEGNTSASNKIHPTQKPVALYKWLLNNYAKPGDRILDTHGGSMSIAIACYDLGFSLDLCELDKDYFEAGQKRLDDHIAKYAPCSERPATSKGELKLF
jgi:site-specific DNA-methyltransferase (adenine-specific)